MQTIREKVYTHYAGKRSNSMKKENFLKFIQKIQKDIEKVNVKLIRKSKGYRVRTYRELVKYVAELGFLIRSLIFYIGGKIQTIQIQMVP